MMQHSNSWLNLIEIVLLLSFAGVFGGILTTIAMILDGDKKLIKCSLIALVVISVICFLSWSSIIKVDDSPLVWTKTASEKLVALNDNNVTTGKFYARRGYISEDLYYQYMVDVGGGGYVANKVPSNGTTVYIDNNNPRCEWYEISQEWFIFKQWKTGWKLYVPEGTIGDTYVIDLQ